MTQEEYRVLENRIYQTLEKPILESDHVISACNEITGRIKAGRYHEIIRANGLQDIISPAQLNEAASLLNREALSARIHTELDREHDKLYPLGVLCHIGAGNVEGLAVYSIIEGLLTGNINLVKLSSADDGITEFLVGELTALEPQLADYIYLFRISSRDQDAVRQLTSLADGIVVWGGDSTVRAIRELAAPNQKVIEWGHKISFAYVTMNGISETGVAGLAAHIIRTRQQLCSSCQGIYLECEQEEQLHQFAGQLLTALEKVSEQDPAYDIGIAAQTSIKRYLYQLEQSDEGTRIYQGSGVNVFVRNDSELEPSLELGNIWLKRLPRPAVVRTLRKHHGHLQTVGLLCHESESEELGEIFSRAGVTRIRTAAGMSAVAAGEPHDGVYPLRCYTKFIDKVL